MNLKDRLSRLEEKKEKPLAKMSHNDFLRSVGINPDKYNELSSDDQLKELFPAIGLPGDFKNMTSNELDDILLDLLKQAEEESGHTPRKVPLEKKSRQNHDTHKRIHPTL